MDTQKTPWLNDRLRVRAEYSSETALIGRRAAYRYAEGPDAPEMLFEAISKTGARSFLEVGPGPGELAERIQKDLGGDIVGVDISPRMAQLANERGICTLVGDAEALPVGDSLFDCVIAAWMLYHAEDIDRALSEIRRVLRSGGSLIAVTNWRDHLAEIRGLVGVATSGDGPFPGDEAPSILARHFDSVDVQDAPGTIRFPDRGSLEAFIRSLQMFYGEPDLPDAIEFPFVVRRHPVILVARAPE